MSAQLADVLDQALARNARVGNVRGSLTSWSGGECIEGSLRRVGATRRERRAIARATFRTTGYLGHAEANDAAPRRGDMAVTMGRVSAALRVERGSSGRARDAAVVVTLAGAVALVATFSAVLLVALELALSAAMVAALAWVVRAALKRRTAARTAVTSARSAWLVAVPARGPIALGTAERVADDALRAAWTTEAEKVSA